MKKQREMGGGVVKKENMVDIYMYCLSTTSKCCYVLMNYDSSMPLVKLMACFRLNQWVNKSAFVVFFKLFLIDCDGALV